jgi:hypothetical protein
MPSSSPPPGLRFPAAAAAGLAAALALCGCESPRWQVEAAPPEASVFVDGRVRPGHPIEGPIPYYGVVDLAAVPAFRERPARRAERAALRIDEPVTPWLFPLDFFVESAVALFEPDPVRSASLELEERDDLPARGDAPPDAETFAARARAAATTR